MAAPPPPVPPDLRVRDTSLPRELEAFISELEQWAVSNIEDARKDTIRFWSLKLPAIFSSASAAVFALLHLETITAILAAISSACVLVDAAYPGGQLRNAHLRAAHELRNLQHQVRNEWRVGALKLKNPTELAATILQSSEKVRSRIATDLRLAETSFGKTGKLK